MFIFIWILSQFCVHKIWMSAYEALIVSLLKYVVPIYLPNLLRNSKLKNGWKINDLQT